MNGIYNWFVLNNIFGDNFSLNGSQVCNMKSTPFDGRLSIDIVTVQKVINPSPRWKEWNEIYIGLDFFDVNEIHTKITYENFIITDFSIEPYNKRYILNIRSEKNGFIKAVSTGGIVQNVRPMPMDSDF